MIVKFKVWTPFSILVGNVFDIAEFDKNIDIVMALPVIPEEVIDKPILNRIRYFLHHFRILRDLLSKFS